MLPGAQALLGFQFIAVLTERFTLLPPLSQAVHVAALVAVLLSTILLIAPATIHRLAFAGQDDQRFYEIGSNLVTAALAPLAIGIAGDVYVAFTIMIDEAAGTAVAVASLILLFSCWYVIPLAARHRHL